MDTNMKTKVSVLFSGGKDCCLAAVMLSKFFEVELITCNFGVLSNWKKAEQVAEKLNIHFHVLKLDERILEEAAEQTIKDGFPNNGIKYIHQKALEEVAKISPKESLRDPTGQAEFIADGVRRDDRVPVLSLPEVRRIEDKFKVHYIQPLMGYSRKTINLLVEKFFTIKEYKSSASFIGAEYEFELKDAIKKKYGIKKIQEIFPKGHTHSIVVKVKRAYT